MLPGLYLQEYEADDAHQQHHYHGDGDHATLFRLHAFLIIGGLAVGPDVPLVALVQQLVVQLAHREGLVRAVVAHGAAAVVLVLVDHEGPAIAVDAKGPGLPVVLAHEEAHTLQGHFVVGTEVPQLFDGTGPHPRLPAGTADRARVHADARIHADVRVISVVHSPLPVGAVRRVFRIARMIFSARGARSLSQRRAALAAKPLPRQ